MGPDAKVQREFDHEKRPITNFFMGCNEKL